MLQINVKNKLSLKRDEYLILLLQVLSNSVSFALKVAMPKTVSTDKNSSFLKIVVQILMKMLETNVKYKITLKRGKYFIVLLLVSQ